MVAASVADSRIYFHETDKELEILWHRFFRLEIFFVICPVLWLTIRLFLNLKEMALKKIFIVCILIAAVVAGCSSRKESAKLVQGTPAYQLAKDLAAKLPSLDPDKNEVMISTKEFTITTGDIIQTFQDRMGTRAAQLKELNVQDLKNAIEQNAVRMGERKLLLAASAKVKSSVTPDELNKALNDQYTQAGGEQQFLEILKTNGVAVESFKKAIQDDLLIQKYLEANLFKTIAATDAEIQKAYAEDKTASVRHILMLTQGKTEAEKAEIRKKMEGLLAKAKGGEDFAALAKQYSEDPGSKDSGGLIPEEFGRGRMVKPFEDAAFSVPVGQISGIVETAYGFHILKVEGRKKEILPLDQVKTQLEEQIKQQKKVTAFESHMAKLKEKAKFSTVGFKA
jgi:parvulin-like peptidyl-prolyl isomerase